jgi:hypothetical protein
LRLDGDHANVGVLLLEVPGRAGDGAAGAETGEEVVDLSLSLLPDFRPGGLEVCPNVVGILILSIVNAIFAPLDLQLAHPRAERMRIDLQEGGRPTAK